MTAGDLVIITQIATFKPIILPFLVNIYKLAYKQGQIDLLKEKYGTTK
jgi:hypothetical protein